MNTKCYNTAFRRQHPGEPQRQSQRVSSWTNGTEIGLLRHLSPDANTTCDPSDSDDGDDDSSETSCTSDHEDELLMDI